MHTFRAREERRLSATFHRHHHLQQGLQELLLQRRVAEARPQEVPPELRPEPADAGVGTEEAGVKEVRLCMCAGWGSYKSADPMN